MSMNFTQHTSPLVEVGKSARVASRRGWLKSVGTLLGTGLLAAPASLLAGPNTPAALPLPASEAVGGDEYIGMVKLLRGTTAPAGWTLCDGRLLSIEQHRALFAVLSNTYGGDGRTTFALPDLRDTTSVTVPAAAGGPHAAAQGTICAIKVANAAATTTSVAELRLRHHYRPRTAAV